MNRRRDLSPLSDALAEITAELQPATGIARIQTAWPEAVGPTVAKWAEPVSERAGVVTFACTDSMVAHELEMMKPELLKKLKKVLPDGAPTELKFVIR
jgi:predicted nucleic acid-binding Zn ribbon protein